METPTPRAFAWASRAGLIVKPAQWLAAAYGLGFVITNIHLSHFAEVDGTLLRPRYLAAGILFVVVLGLPAVTAMLVMLWEEQLRVTEAFWADGWRRRARGPVLYALSLGVMYNLWSNVILDVIAVERHKVGEGVMFTLASVFGALYTSIARDYVKLLSMPESDVIKHLNDAIVQVAVVLIALLSSAAGFANRIYPVVAPEFGGGAVPVVRVTLDSPFPSGAIADALSRRVGLVSRADPLIYFASCDSASATHLRTFAVRSSVIRSIEFEQSNMRSTPRNRLLGLTDAMCSELARP